LRDLGSFIISGSSHNMVQIRVT